MRAGPPRRTPRPQERAGTVRGAERINSPAPLPGVLRGVPAEGVGGDRAAAPAQGKAFPSVRGFRSCYVCLLVSFNYGCPMTSRPNLPSSLEAIRISLQARAILDVLAKEGGANSRLLETWLATIGLTASSRAMTDLLDRLEKDGLVRLEQVDTYRVVRIRRFGGEVASGLEALGWIAKPELPE